MGYVFPLQAAVCLCQPFCPWLARGYVAPAPPEVAASVLPGGTSAVAVSLKALAGRVAQCASFLCQATGLDTIWAFWWVVFYITRF